MKIKQLHTAFFLSLCAALAACSDQDALEEYPSTGTGTNTGKTPIELSVGGVEGMSASATTRAVITDDNTKTYKPFDKPTKIFMVMKSSYGTEDYQGSHKDKYTVSRGDVAANQTKISFDNLNQKYWDDAHARSSMLDIWAYAAMVPTDWNSCSFQVPNQSWDGSNQLNEYQKGTFYTGTQEANKSPYPWKEHDFNNGTGDKGSKGAIYPCIMEWSVTTTPWTQSANSIQYQDLMFSNNLADNSTNGGEDKRLKYGTQNSGKFDVGEMKFYHAMSKITINIIEGDGFVKDGVSKDADFQFKDETNVKLTGFNTKGTFNIKNGSFEMVETPQTITSIYQTKPKGADPEPYYVLQALAIPNINGTNGCVDTYSRFESSKNNPETDAMMEFTIDNNTYKITSKQLYDALHDKEGAIETTTGIIPLEAGKNYVFTFKVNKTKLSNITAQVADWETVNA